MRRLLAALIISLSVSLSAQQATVEGTLEITDADYLNGAANTTYALNTGTERLVLHFDRAPNVRPGQRVRVRGARQGQAMQVASMESGPQSLALTPRHMSLLVLLYGFSDRPVTWQASDFAHIFGDSHLVAFWEENAYGMLDITGTVIGPYTIPSSYSQCDRYQWWTEAYLEAVNAGIDPLAYEKILHVVPANDCPWAGIAERGGRNAWTVFSNLYISGHEVGHLLGLRHSNSLVCFSPTVCQGYEYGDTHDIMGSISVHTNATQKMALGW